jgi:ABC-type Mn2+/Zn2+ transport system ATPase subunit
MSTIAWENLVVGYSDKRPLTYAFSGQIKTPGIYAITGQNGCGKSTLLKTWLGLIKPLSGKITIGNTPLPTHHNISQGIAYVPQFHSVNQYFHITVSDFIKQGYGPNYKVTESDVQKISQLLLQWQLAGFEKKSFHQLSGGQKVRSMLVRAIISKPRLLFLDEPLASLDVCCQLQLMDTLKELVTAHQMCVFMVDHHFENFESYITQKIVFSRKHDEERSFVAL